MMLRRNKTPFRCIWANPQRERIFTAVTRVRPEFM